MLKQTKACMLLLSIIVASSSIAQTKIKPNTHTAIDSSALKKDSVKPAKSYFKADLNFVSNAVYLGRKDSTTLPYITPSIGYYNNLGFYVGAAASYSTTDKRFDYFSLDAGYEFSFNEKFGGTVYANKSFYNDSSSNVSSDIGAGLGAAFTYDFGFLELGAGTDISFASKTDYGVNFSVSRSFYLGTDDKQWSFSPSIAANFNTLNFYEGYTSKTSGKKQKKKNPLVTSVTSTTTITNKNVNALTLMDYEITVPVSYDAKKWGVYFTPTLALPQNAIYTKTTSVIKFRSPPAPNSSQTVIVDSTPSSEKNLSSVFYAEVGVYFKF